MGSRIGQPAHPFTCRQYASLRFEDSFVVHFGGDFSRINAYTLATTLINIADAAKANAALNPGYEIEVVVEALGGGSFRATVRAIYKAAGNLFTGDSLRAVVLGVIASYVYQHTLAPSPSLKVTIESKEVVVDDGDTKLVVPRDVHEAMTELETNTRFRASVGQAIRAVEEDPAIQTFGFAPSPDQDPPAEIPKSRLSVLTNELPEAAANVREIIELTDVEILKAILEKSRRKWEFVWNGMKILRTAYGCAVLRGLHRPSNHDRTG